VARAPLRKIGATAAAVPAFSGVGPCIRPPETFSPWPNPSMALCMVILVGKFEIIL
jgi:hypothetical protein